MNAACVNAPNSSTSPSHAESGTDRIPMGVLGAALVPAMSPRSAFAVRKELVPRMSIQPR